MLPDRARSDTPRSSLPALSPQEVLPLTTNQVTPDQQSAGPVLRTTGMVTDERLCMKRLLLTPIVALGILCGGGPFAAGADTAAKPATEAGAAADGKFMEAAAQGGLTEVAASEQAEDRTKRDEVKHFAKMMIKDHKDVHKNLKSVTDKMNIQLPKEPSAEQKAALEKLKASTDADFDRTYAEMMVSDHKKTIALFEGFSKSGTHADLKAFVNNTLPGLRTHLKHAEDLAKAVGAK
jgi:putative membrane protein